VTVNYTLFYASEYEVIGRRCIHFPQVLASLMRCSSSSSFYCIRRGGVIRAIAISSFVGVFQQSNSENCGQILCPWVECSFWEKKLYIFLQFNY